MDSEQTSDGGTERDHGRAPRRGEAVRGNVAAVEAVYQLILWMMPVLDELPRRQKFQLGDRLKTTALNVLDTLIEAAYTRDCKFQPIVDGHFSGIVDAVSG
jgi:hypothetical protein